MKNKKGRRVKVLQLESWMKWVCDAEMPHDSDITYYADEVPPVFNRDGYYMAYDTEWFEYKGKAYELKRPGGFPYKLMLLNHTPLSREERAAFTLLINNHRVSRRLRELLWTDKNWWDLRDIVRGALKFRQRFTEYKKKVKPTCKQ